MLSFSPPRLPFPRKQESSFRNSKKGARTPVRRLKQWQALDPRFRGDDSLFRMENRRGVH